MREWPTSIQSTNLWFMYHLHYINSNNINHCLRVHNLWKSISQCPTFGYDFNFHLAERTHALISNIYQDKQCREPHQGSLQDQYLSSLKRIQFLVFKVFGFYSLQKPYIWLWLKYVNLPVIHHLKNKAISPCLPCICIWIYIYWHVAIDLQCLWKCWVYSRLQLWTVVETW